MTDGGTPGPIPRSGEIETSATTIAALEAEIAHLRRTNANLNRDLATLREHEAQQSVILNSAADYAIITADLRHRITGWNTGAVRMMGWTAAEIIGQPADIFFTPEDRADGALAREAARALTEGRATNERWHQRKDGSQFWGSGLSMPMHGPGARPGAKATGILKIMRDHTARRRADDALREEKSRWRSVFKRMHEGFALCELVYDANKQPIDFCYLEVNDAWERLTGVPATSTVGRRASELFPGIEDFWVNSYAEVVRSGVPATFEYHLGPVGRWYEVRAYRTGPNRFAALFLDVTDRRQIEADARSNHAAMKVQEARLRLALEASRLGFWEFDLATDAAFRSPQHDAIFGYPDGVADWGLNIFIQHVLPEDRPQVEETLRTAVAGGTVWSFEARIRRADTGEMRWIEARGQTAQDGSSKPIRLHGVVADITDRKRAEERRSVLVGELNHRVKNTLAVVQSIAAQTARRATDLPAFSAAFQARLIALAGAHDLLTRQEWQGAAFDEVVRATLDPLALDSNQVDLSGCTSTIILSPSAALGLTMAIHELATNARKHGALSTSEGRISIVCRPTDPQKHFVVMDWLEQGGPPIDHPPARKGFGLRLLERGLPTEVGMQAEISFHRSGLHCQLRLMSGPGALSGPG